MIDIKYISGEIFRTIDYNNNNNNMSYEEIKLLFDSNIIIDQYYMIVNNIDNNTENIYTNLYDIYEMKYKKNIILNDINIIFLPYDKLDVDKIKKAEKYHYSLDNNNFRYIKLDISV